ncbi:glycosyltransferase family 4 protein [Tuber brumale]|nr:glycosyltransferase family 4 protein [Tuber brumale]
MDAPGAPHYVTDPIDTTSLQNEPTGETPLYLGMAATKIDGTTVKTGVSILGDLYTLDHFTREFSCSDGQYMGDVIRKNTIHIVVAYSISYRARFVGAGVTRDLEEICHGFCAYIWRKLDIVCVVSKAQTTPSGTHLQRDSPIDLDQQAHLAAHAEEAIRLVEDLQQYKETVHESTWKTVLSYANELMGYKDGQQQRKPTEFCTQLGVDMSWYIPEPNPEASRITKTNHNILQGVADPEARFDKRSQDILDEWMRKHAERYCLSPGGPLAPGGADVVIIDDPQMPALIPLIKKVRPEDKIIYRSHIEVRKDLVAIPWSPQRLVWEWIWNHIRKADVFISHPVSTFVPYSVTLEMVSLMPACTDWLDGLNKPLSEWDLRFYHHNLHNICNEREMNHLLYPRKEYITQIARFDPSKGIPDVIESYRKLCVRLRTDSPERLPPQLLICEHGAIDDPDAEIVYNETIALLRKWRYAPIAKDVIVVRIGPSDQMLNAMITTVKIVMQLSLREGFEGIEDAKSGFLVEVGDTDTVADRLFELYTNDDLYAMMIKHAKASVSDEVGTVGNAACWLCPAAKLARGEGLAPNTGWIMDMARAEPGHRYVPGEPMLSRTGIDFKGEAK